MEKGASYFGTGYNPSEMGVHQSTNQIHYLPLDWGVHGCRISVNQGDPALLLFAQSALYITIWQLLIVLDLLTLQNKYKIGILLVKKYYLHPLRNRTEKLVFIFISKAHTKYIYCVFPYRCLFIIFIIGEYSYVTSLCRMSINQMYQHSLNIQIQERFLLLQFLNVTVTSYY